ncbi:MAG: glycosyltransferase [Candidatus Omnitrophica bacterium]|nr:glycosyltransferase [Candidatus Omnitrophota bacterium]
MRIILLTRMDRLSGARIAQEMIRAGQPPVAVVVEKTLSFGPTTFRVISEAIRIHGVSKVAVKGWKMARTRARGLFRKCFPSFVHPPHLYDAIQDVLRDHPLPYFSTEDLNSPASLKFIRERQPDLLVVANTGLLKKPLLEIPPKGSLNLHLGLLPKYRGLDSMEWALSRREEEVGVTIHFVDEKIDHGPILLQKSFKVDPKESVEALTEQAIQIGSHLMVEAISLLAEGKAKSIPQDEAKASYFSRFPRKARRELGKRISQKVKVLHVITRLDRGGSSENTLLTLLRLDPSRYELSLIYGKTTEFPEERMNEARKAGILLLPLKEMIRSIHPWKDLIAFWKLYRWMRKGGYDLVHTHTSKAGILGRFAAKYAGVPRIVHTPHGHVFYGYFSPMVHRGIIWIERFAGFFTDRLVTLTQRGKEEHLRYKILPEHRITWAYSGIDLEAFRRGDGKEDAFPSPEKGPCVGMIGRLAPIKGHLYFLQALPSVIREIPELKALLVGDGPLRQELEKACSTLGIQHHVLFLGEQERIQAILKRCDVVVLSSLNEGMGRVLLEAQAMGKPVIGTRVGGIPEVIQEGKTGYLVPPKDPQALAEKLLLLLKDPEKGRKMGEAARIWVDETFSVQEMVRRIDAVYQELLKEKPISRG